MERRGFLGALVGALSAAAYSATTDSETADCSAMSNKDYLKTWDASGALRHKYTKDPTLGELDTQKINNKLNLQEYAGSSLNECWSNMVSELSQGQSAIVEINPLPDGHPASFSKDGEWIINGEINLNDPENQTAIRMGSTEFVVTSAINSVFNISPTDKTENIRIEGGQFFSDGVTPGAVIRGHGGSRVTVRDLNCSAINTGSWDHLVEWVSDTHPTGELQLYDLTGAFVNDATVELRGESAANAITKYQLENVRGGGTDTIRLGGIADKGRIEQVVGRNDAQAVSNAVVKAETDATNDLRPRRVTVSNIYTTQDVNLFQSVDKTSGAASKMGQWYIGPGLAGKFQSEAFNIAYMSGCTIDFEGNQPLDDYSGTLTGTAEKILLSDPFDALPSGNLTDNTPGGVLNTQYA